jgi:hypothetical protein
MDFTKGLFAVIMLRKQGGIDMSSRHSAAAPAQQSAVSPGLLGGAQDLLAEINSQCLDMLCALAAAGQVAAPLGADIAPLWRRLTPEARQRLAAAPYLLADAGFSDDSRWRRLQAGSVNDQQRELPASVFNAKSATTFTRRVLVFGWHLARSQPSAARLALGMTPSCLSLIAALRLQDLDRIGELHPGWVRPRWEAHPEIWRNMLLAALQGNAAALQQSKLRGIQLLGAVALAPATTLR